MTLRQSTILSYLLESGGRVKNAELVRAFTDFINCSDPAERKNNRDLFKGFVSNVAVVKRIDQIKYVVVRKKYEHMIRDARGLENLKSSDAPLSIINQSECATASADDFNNNCCVCTCPNIPACCFITDAKVLDTQPENEIHPTACDAVILPPSAGSSKQDVFSPRQINVGNKIRIGNAATVLTVVAQIAPAGSQPERINLKLDSTQHTVEEFAGGSEAYNLDLHPSPRTKRRQSLVQSTPAQKQCTKLTKPGLDTKVSVMIPLKPREHEWLVYSATGCWSQLHSLLQQDVHLAERRSFISGFNCLHWAAKHGNTSMVCNIFDVARQAGIWFDVNTRTHDGYTALHIGAIHSHQLVLKVLVHEYGANCSIRDNSGKKAYHYLHEDVTPEVREMLGDPHVVHQCTPGHQVLCSDDDNHYFLGINTLSKLLKASVGNRKKSRR